MDFSVSYLYPHFSFIPLLKFLILNIQLHIQIFNFISNYSASYTIIQFHIQLINFISDFSVSYQLFSFISNYSVSYRFLAKFFCLSFAREKCEKFLFLSVLQKMRKFLGEICKNFAKKIGRKIINYGIQ